MQNISILFHSKQISTLFGALEVHIAVWAYTKVKPKAHWGNLWFL